jgi:TRAP-type C4-dicarboxylate transport system permease small subunit
MHELAILTLAVAALMAATAAAARWIAPLLRRIERLFLAGSILVILFVMFFVCAEVVMRYGFNAPIPGHLESSELLMPAIVFLALSYTQATHGHVGMDLLLGNLPAGARRLTTMATLIVSIFVCAVIAYFSFKNALQLWRYDDVTMSPPYFRTWPSAAAIPLGYGMVAFRMFLQVLSLYDPRRFPPDAEAADGIHGAE